MFLQRRVLSCPCPDVFIKNMPLPPPPQIKCVLQNSGLRRSKHWHHTCGGGGGGGGGGGVKRIPFYSNKNFM
jgi:hypothetical protein